MSDKYILDGEKVVECDDLIKWAKWFEKGNRKVAFDQHDDVKVSTVFLGLDHSFGEGPPLLFETMIFGGEHDQDQDRYSTWEEAKAGHAVMCKKAFNDTQNARHEPERVSDRLRADVGTEET